MPESAPVLPGAAVGSWREALVCLFSGHSRFLRCALTAVHFPLRTTSATSLVLQTGHPGLGVILSDRLGV